MTAVGPAQLRPVPIDPELRAELRAVGPIGALPGETPLEQERRRRRRIHAERFSPTPDVMVRDSTLGGVKVRSYTAPLADRAAPTLVWFHGGGWIYGDSASDDAMAMTIVQESGVTVVSVDYRLAPEHPYPAAVDDAEVVFSALATRAGNSGGLILGGASSGANIAAGLALRLRDQGKQLPVAQLLIYPPLDDRATDEDDGPLTRQDVTTFWTQYLGTQIADDYAAPARADNLAGLPRTYLFATSGDPLRLEGWRFAMRLVEAGVEVEAQFLPGGYHGFDYELPDTRLARRAVRDWVSALRRIADDMRADRALRTNAEQVRG